jgi:phytoene dehydrogenase-like protein
MLRFARHLALPVRRLADETFAGAGGGLLLAGNTLHTDMPVEGAGGGLFGWLLASLGQQHGFPVPEGGAGRLTAALVDRLRSRGGRLECNARVAHIEVRGGRAVGVVTEDGTAVAANRAVLADVVAPALFLDLVGADHLPARFLDGIRRFQFDHATVKVDWALRSPIRWGLEGPAGAGTVHLADSLDHLTRYTADLVTGRLPDDPFLILGQMTTTDPTRSPAGTETAWAYTHVPHRPWDDADTERFADRMQARIERYAPGFGDLVLARHVFTPSTMQAANESLVLGAVNGGTAQLHQQLVFRPVPGLGRASTPIGGLYLASSSAHPGGGVHGACGANAARAALSPWRRP